MKIVEWMTTYGLVALQWYALYVVIAGGAFALYLWHKLWRKGRGSQAAKADHHDHRRAD